MILYFIFIYTYHIIYDISYYIGKKLRQFTLDNITIVLRENNVAPSEASEQYIHVTSIYEYFIFIYYMFFLFLIPSR